MVVHRPRPVTCARTAGPHTPARKPIPAAELISDSESDPPDELLAAGLALALNPCGSFGSQADGGPALQKEDAAACHTTALIPMNVPYVLDLCAAHSQRLADYQAREPNPGAQAFIRLMRDTFKLPPKLVLALVLMDQPARQWLQDGSPLFSRNCDRELAVGQFYSVIDMVDPIAGHIACAMSARNEMSSLVKQLTAL